MFLSLYYFTAIVIKWYHLETKPREQHKYIKVDFGAIPFLENNCEIILYAAQIPLTKVKENNY